MENQKPAPEERPEVSFVTKEMMEDYEFIRQTGVANMFDYYSVTAFARKTGAISIANLSSEDYKKILLNFGYLMKKFDIKQPGRKNASD